MKFISKTIVFLAIICAFAFHGISQNNSKSLNGNWNLVNTDYLDGNGLKKLNVNNHLSVRYQAPVPMDLNQFFMQEGISSDINIGVNTLKASWIALQNWVYSRNFDAPNASQSEHSWLIFDKLDYRAIICLNGEIVATHKNAHYPCKVDVSGKLKAQGNELKIAIESGFFTAATSDWENGVMSERQLKYKFPLLRKANYQFGWDWCPELVNIGITGDVNLEWTNYVRIDQLTVWNKLNEDFTKAKVTVRAFLEGKSGDFTLKTTVKETGKTYQRQISVKNNQNPYLIEFEIVNPKLWWPIGQGDQNLYHFKIDILKNKELVATKNTYTGIRKVELDESPHPEKGNYFILKVNNRPIYCKGSNWVPPELINTGISEEKYENLVNMALDANMNMLRIWGGAVYADPYFMKLCDEKGIMIWHDFMFACQTFPGHLADFSNDLEREIPWISREYAHHPSIVLWCGNNEVQYLYHITGKVEKHSDYYIYHNMIPRILHIENPETPYWPGSPFSTSIFDIPNEFTSGDQHAWNMNEVDYTVYRDWDAGRFISEFGFMGASTPKTLDQFLPDNERKYHSHSWVHHDNTINTGRTSGITYKMLDYWMGRNYLEMPIEEYAIASMLLQGEALSEFILAFRKHKFDNAGQLFWMYNDAFPQTHGWTILDYYLRKKLSYYNIKRVYADLLVIAAHQGDSINFYGINDKSSDWEGILRTGAFEFAGKLKDNETTVVKIPANGAVILKSISIKNFDLTDMAKEAVFARLETKEGNLVYQNRLLATKFKDIKFKNSNISITRQGEYAVFQSNAYVWGVMLDINGEVNLPDNNFDLIPNIPYQIKWPKNKELPVVLKTGNEFFIK